MAERGRDLPTVIDALHAGDELALAKIYHRWSPLVYSIALGALKHVADVLADRGARARSDATVGASTQQDKRLGPSDLVEQLLLADEVSRWKALSRGFFALGNQLEVQPHAY